MTPDALDLATTLDAFAVDSSSGVPRLVQLAVQLARALQRRGAELQTREEKRQQREFERMMQSESDKVTLTKMTDQAFRSKTPSRAADQLTHILDVQGIPRFFSGLERAMLKGFQSFGSYLPSVSIPRVKERMRDETANVILPGEADLLRDYLQQRRSDGLRMNVNYLGEALLGEEDARRRLKSYLAALQRPEIECISVKVSTIYSQITPLSRRHATRVLCDRMELLYLAAAKERFERHDGSLVPKFVYLDMEEYRDLRITLDVFMQTLDRKGLEEVPAGIALQAYVPDSHLAQREITEWAKGRTARGGAPVTVRLVKGANMEAERVEASLYGWPQAPFQSKAETDANYKRMLHYALDSSSLAAVRLGIATHNLFEVAYALVLVQATNAEDHVQFEMLEGMANHQRRALMEFASNMLLYAPATKREDFISAIGYLIRRLDENTGPENFLRYAFKLEVGGDDWNMLEQQFVDSVARFADVEPFPRRRQDRSTEGERLAVVAPSQAFCNDPDTDFSLGANLAWAEQLVEDWQKRCGDNAMHIPLVVAGEKVEEHREERSCLDPSRPGTVVARYCQANSEDIERALLCAKNDPAGWRSLDENKRAEILARVAHELRLARGELIGAAVADAGKLVSEADPELSEAVDFVEYYARSANQWRSLSGLDAEPLGVVVVVPPWNFPIAIPCGGIAAALAAGNTVILKPASHTVLVAYQLCCCFWRAGVPQEALQLVPCAGRTGGAKLVASPDVDAVILTGGTDTALRMLDARPTMNLLAETGGKNATIVSAMSDRDQAIKHVVQSAFGHSGQKCSATSLLVLEAEVYDDPAFRQTLCDAVRSISVGSAWSFKSKMGPLTHAPSGDLVNGLKVLEKNEEWAVMPRRMEDNPCLYSPGLRWGVVQQSYTHMTEFFGPVLAVMRADNLEHAVEIVNQTGYGLTSGLESLDVREQAFWRDNIRAGNLYINRVTTGAIVERQPFGGMGKSAFGPGIKAGGPNYVAQLMRFRDSDREVSTDGLGQRMVRFVSMLAGRGDYDRLLGAIASYEKNYREEFGQEHDVQKLVGQDNVRRYLPVANLRIRVAPEDSPFEILARACAACIVGCRATVSSPPGLGSETVAMLDELTEEWGAMIEFVVESDEELAEVVRSGETQRVRYAAPERIAEVVARAVGDTGVCLVGQSVVAEGRLELLWYCQEQSISHNYHRYGNLGERAKEKRRPVL